MEGSGGDQFESKLFAGLSPEELQRAYEEWLRRQSSIASPDEPQPTDSDNTGDNQE